MPTFYNEQALIENLRQYAKNGLLSAGYSCDGLEKIRLEIINGMVVFCSWQTPKYGKIKTNLITLFARQFPNLKEYYKKFGDYYQLTHIDVKIDDNNLYNPAMFIEKITQENSADNIEYFQKPIIIFEILTAQNKHLLNAKFEHYQRLESLQEYVLIDLNAQQIWRYGKEAHRQPKHYKSGQSLILNGIDFTLNVNDIYYGIDI